MCGNPCEICYAISRRSERRSTQHCAYFRWCGVSGFIGGKCENILNNKYLMVTNVYRSAKIYPASNAELSIY